MKKALACLAAIALLAMAFGGCTTLAPTLVPTEPPKEATPAPTQAPTPEPTAAPTPAPTVAPTPTPEPTPAGPFPITFKAYNNSYSVTGYEVTTDKDGNTAVKLLGTGFGTIPFRNGKWAFPMLGSIICAGTTYEVSSVNTGNDGYTMIFKTKDKPDTVILLNGETNKELLKFDVTK